MKKLSMQNKADIALICVAIVWGFTFLPISQALKTNGVFTILFWRFFISAILMSLISLKFIDKIDIKSVKYGIILGAVLFSSFAAQTFALKHTFSSTVAFITGLECVIVPFIAGMFFSQKITIYAIIGAFTAIVGLWFLSDAKLALGFGEFLALICAITYALYTVLNGHFVRKGELYTLVCAVFFTIAALSFICALVFESGVLPVLDRAFFIALVISVLFGTIFAYLVQTSMQRYTSATKTALFFSLEPVSAGLVGYFFGGEILGVAQILGAALIVIGVLIAECASAALEWVKFKLRRI